MNGRYLILLDPNASADPPITLDLPRGVDVAEALEALLVAEPRVEEVKIVVDAEEIGVSSRGRVAELTGSDHRLIGDGDGAALPGWSAKYRLLRFTCPACSAEVRRVHVDERNPPQCPNGHGPLV